MTQVTPDQSTEPDSNPSVKDVGALIRELREDRDLTIAELRDRSGVSPGLISQIERGQGNPAYLTLIRIAQALEVPVGTFFAPASEGDRRMLVRADQRRRLQITDHGLVYELLTPTMTGRLAVVLARIPPGFSNETAPFDHPGGEESLLLLEGKFHVHVGGRDFILEAGDSLTYDSGPLHWFRNVGTGEAVLVGSMSPPVF